ncbi:glycosyltransferase family 4 protein [uncultured Jatrophihabitans sp.]|uniref:glycosyltransferase family 4 protein n=1 Tax=uncultured Jatrophihabitans sp. TaxID=1610747 RepID=UPI0035CC9C10
MWEALGRKVPLSVGLLAGSERNRRWSNELPAEVSHHRFRAGVLRADADPLYVLKGLALRRFGRDDAVVLPGWEHPAAWQLLAEARMRGVATVAFYESNRQSHRFARGPIPRARSWFFQHVDVVLTVGQASWSVVTECGVDPSCVVMTHNSIDTDAFANDSVGGELPNRETKRFAYVGQLIQRKNVESLLRALALCGGDYELDVVGEGPLEANLRALAESLGVATRVTFCGYVEPEAVAQRLKAVSTLVLPSTAEVFGLAPVEALAFGRHVVVSSAAGVTADIAGMPGVWVADPDPVALSHAMCASSNDWDGPIGDPPIREWTPDRFAADALHAVQLAILRRQGRRWRG